MDYGAMVGQNSPKVCTVRRYGWAEQSKSVYTTALWLGRTVQKCVQYDFKFTSEYTEVKIQIIKRETTATFL